MIETHYNKGLSGEFELYLCDRDQNLEPGITYGPVIRDIYVIECCTGGKGGVSINGRYYPIQKGDCIVLLPGDIIVHYADKTEPREGVWCAVDGMMIKGILKSARITSEQPYADPRCFEGVRMAMEKMLTNRESEDAGRTFREQACVAELFGELLRAVPEKKESRRYVDVACRMIEARYDQKLTVSDLAAEVGLERCYFSALFQKEMAVSPYQYLLNYRLKKACALILNGYKIREAALAVGIPPETFSRLFKKHFGVTPGEYASTRDGE